MWRTVVSASVQSCTVASVADPVFWIVRLSFPTPSVASAVIPPAFLRRKNGPFCRLVNAHSVQRQYNGLQYLLQKERCLVRRRTYVRGQLQGANVLLHASTQMNAAVLRCRNASGTEHGMAFWQPAVLCLSPFCQGTNHQMSDAMQGKDAIEFLESLIVGDVASLEDRTGTLSVFTNDKGGIIDDSVITKVCCETMHCIMLHMLCCSSQRLTQSSAMQAYDVLTMSVCHQHQFIIKSPV